MCAFSKNSLEKKILVNVCKRLTKYHITTTYVHTITEVLFFHSDVDVNKLTLTKLIFDLLETVYVLMMLDAKLQYL